MNTKYTEIFRLRDMLDAADIEYSFYNFSFRNAYEHYQIEVFNSKNIRIISVAEGDATFGRKDNLLEIHGCLTPEEEKRDSVAGYLTAENVFERIKKALAEV